MKNIFSALFFSLFGATALMTSCSDVPAPYEIMSPGDIELVGDGSKDNPYNVATAAMKQDGSTAWVQGYIVGVMETNVDPFSPNFAAPFNTESNLMIADSPEEQNKKNCIIVQLPVGDIRTALNLKAHADNLGKPVSLQGKLTAYFSSNGLKEVTAATFNGEEIGNGEGGEVVPPAPGEDPFGLDASKTSTEFIADFEDIKDFNQVYTKEGWVNKALAKGNPWQTATFKEDKYLKMNTYNTQEGDKVESWFITPAFVVGNKSKLSFDCAGANFTAEMHLKVFFLQKDASGKVSQEEIIVNEIPTSGNNYAWAKDINVDLSKYNGKTGFVGFQYTATGNGSTKGLPTYQIDNIKYSGENEGGEVVPPTPGEADIFISEYVEGSSMEKYIEIYNPTDKEIDLSAYTLAMHNYSKDGEGGNDSGIKSVQLSGTLAAKQTAVYKHSKAESYSNATAISDEVMNFNGNDPIILYKETDNIIDYLGIDNNGFGKDKTLRRKASVTKPSTTYNAEEWEEAAKNDVSNLGSHAMN